MKMKGYALLVGIDQVNVDYYGENKHLCSSEADTRAIEGLLYSTGNFDENTILIRNSAKTKWSRIMSDLAYMKRLASLDKSDHFIFLYFSGHTASIQNPYDQKGRLKQFLCLYDQLVLEDVIKEQISEFPANCKIFVVFDSCYSQGYGEKIIQMPRNPLEKDLSEEFRYIFKLHNEAYKDIIKKYQDYQFEPKAECFFLFACGANQTTLGGASCKETSQFTTSFCSDWTSLNGKSSSNYWSLLEKLKISTSDRVRHKIIPQDTKYFDDKFPLIF